MTHTADQATPDISDLAPTGPSTDRIGSLDFIRGLAVMGILAANIVAFGQPVTAYMYPDAFLTPHGEMEGAMWVAQFVLIDGKMRALFTLLFGAGLYLFMERAWARGATRWLQARRLVWLGLFGLLHYFFVWNGDILFLYAVAGLCVLPFLGMRARNQLVLGLVTYAVGGLIYMGVGWSMEAAEQGAFVSDPDAAAEMQADMDEGRDEELADALRDAQPIIDGDYAGFVARNFTDNAGDLGFVLLLFWLETWPLMLIGMALYRTGLFAGRFARRKQARLGAGRACRGRAAHASCCPTGAGSGIYLLRHAGGFHWLVAFPSPVHGCRIAGPAGARACRCAWLAGAESKRGGARRVHQLSWHVDPDGVRLPRLGAGPVRGTDARPVVSGGPGNLCNHAAVVETLARPLPLWPAGMALAVPDLRTAVPASTLETCY